jgi:hypothetical protein
MYINIYIHYYIMTFRMKPNINIMKILKDSNYNFINYNKNNSSSNSNNSFLFSDNKKITINMTQAFPEDDDSNNNNNQIILHNVYNVVWNLHVYVINCICNWKLRARKFFYI